MKLEYNNLYKHFVFTNLHHAPLIPEKNRERIQKYFTGIINNNDSKLYAIYAKPDHVHFLASRSPNISEELLATIGAESAESFINSNKLCSTLFKCQNSAATFLVSKNDIISLQITFQPATNHKKITFTENTKHL